MGAAPSHAAAIAVLDAMRTTRPIPHSPHPLHRRPTDTIENEWTLLRRDEAAAAAARGDIAPCWSPIPGTNLYQPCPAPGPGDPKHWADVFAENARRVRGDEEETRRLVAKINAQGSGTTSGGDAAFAPAFRRWLDANPSIVDPPSPMPVTASSQCSAPCENGGWCNRQVGRCHCPSGWTGASCEVRDLWPCNLPKDGATVYELGHPDYQFDFYWGSRCAGSCDQTVGRCLCGPGTKRPMREMVGQCQPDTSAYEGSTWADEKARVVGEKLRDVPGWAEIFGARASPRVKSNATPPRASSDLRAGDEAYCDADLTRRDPPRWYEACQAPCRPGWSGPECDRKTPDQFCLNQCSGAGQGECVDGGFCACRAGWWGVDCSLPVPFNDVRAAEPMESIADAAAASNAAAASGTGERTSAGSIAAPKRRRARPLIYVYETPPDFTTGLLQRRRVDWLCGSRYYDDCVGCEKKGEHSRESSYTYAFETAFHEYVLRSAHRTTDPNEADYFYAPFYSACHTIGFNFPHARHWAGMNPGEDKSRPMALWYAWRKLATLLTTGTVFRDVREARLRRWMEGDPGRRREDYDREAAMDLSDHIFVAPYDEGACALPEELRAATFITHFGNTGEAHERSLTQFAPDSWQAMYRGAPGFSGGSKSWAGIEPVLGGWSCYDPAKDVVAVPWNVLKHGEGRADGWKRGKRPNVFFFAGDLGSPEGVPDSGPHGSDLAHYSAGIRQRIARLALGRDDLDADADANRRERRARIREGFVVSGRRPDYAAQMANATFCGVLPGNGWSGGIFSYVRHGCIPVVVQDGVDMPFERVGPGIFPGDPPYRPEARASETAEYSSGSASARAERVLDYSAFSIRVAERDIERLDELLAGVDDDTVRRLQAGLASAWRLFTYDVPTFPPKAAPRRPTAAERAKREAALTPSEWVIGETMSHDRRLAQDDAGGVEGGGGGGDRDPVGGGAADVEGGDGSGRPRDAFDLLMTTLRYKLHLRRRESGSR